MVERAGFAFHALGEPDGRDAAWAPVFANEGVGPEHVIRELFVGLDTNDVAAAVHELLTDPSYRAAAERVADEIRALPPVEEAVDVLSRSD
jgi:hypothetical protein